MGLVSSGGEKDDKMRWFCQFLDLMRKSRLTNLSRLSLDDHNIEARLLQKK